MFKKEQFYESLRPAEKSLLQALEPFMALYVRGMLSYAEYLTQIDEILEDDEYGLCERRIFGGLTSVAYLESLIRNNSRLPQGIRISEEAEFKAKQHAPSQRQSSREVPRENMRIINKVEDIENLDSTVTYIIFANRHLLRLAHLRKLLEKCPLLEAIQMPRSHSYSIKGEFSTLLEANGVTVIYT